MRPDLADVAFIEAETQGPAATVASVIASLDEEAFYFAGNPEES